MSPSVHTAGGLSCLLAMGFCADTCANAHACPNLLVGARACARVRHGSERDVAMNMESVCVRVRGLFPPRFSIVCLSEKVCHRVP